MKDYISYISIFVVALLLIGGAAVWEGLLTSRFVDAEDPKLDSMKMGIRNIPRMVGDWNGDVSTERREMDDIIAKEAGAEESLARTYTHVGVTRPVSINIICGFARKVAIHTPDACYKGAGFHIVGEIERVEFPYTENPIMRLAAAEKKTSEDEKPAAATEAAGTDEKIKLKTGVFMTAIFEKESPMGLERQRVFWGWKSADSGWEAPQLPRQRWVKGPLAKLYFSTPEGPEDKLQENPAFLFAQSLLPELDYLLSGEFSDGSSPKSVKPEEKAPTAAPQAPPAAGRGAQMDLEKPISDSPSPFISTPVQELDDDPLFPVTTPPAAGGLESLVPKTTDEEDSLLPELPLSETAAPPAPAADVDTFPILDTPPAVEIEPPPPALDMEILPNGDINSLPPLPGL